MQLINDFLVFKFFISPYVLIIFYYIGAILIPFISYSIIYYIKKKYWLATETIDAVKSTVTQMTSNKFRLGFVFVFILTLIFFEIIWRMMIEFLIAYLQIRDALILPSS